MSAAIDAQQFDEAFAAATLLAAALERSQTKIVFAESCTAGLVSAVLAHVPGVSTWHCGSAVTYREATKVGWLGVSAEDLARFTAVSEPVARQMAIGVLRNTPEAQLALSITGHFGPNAPSEFDGVAFVGVARRLATNESSNANDTDDEASDCQVLACHRLKLKASERIARGWEAATDVIRLATELIANWD